MLLEAWRLHDAVEGQELPGDQPPHRQTIANRRQGDGRPVKAIRDSAAYCVPVMARLATRTARLLPLLLVSILVLGACAPSAGQPSLAADEAAANEAAANEAATTDASPAPESSQPAATGDAVTGGEPEPTAEASTRPTPTPTPEPEATPTPPPPSPTATPKLPTNAAGQKPFAMNLYRKGDFVAQYTFEWCVGASLQMALNMVTDESHTSRADQETLWEMARDRSFSPFGGANPTGWTATLNELGVGPYQLVSIPTLDEALDAAAEAIRATERPVGLVMWRGRHAWMMSGFEATADPNKSDDFDVTGIRVQDPLYPHGSSVWGSSPRPNSLVSPATLAKQFVVRDVTRSRVNLGVPTGYLMILPVEDAAA
jgi:hypothetical protein